MSVLLCKYVTEPVPMDECRYLCGYIFIVMAWIRVPKRFICKGLVTLAVLEGTFIRSA